MLDRISKRRILETPSLICGSVEDLVPDEESVLVLTQGGYVKRTNPSEYRRRGFFDRDADLPRSSPRKDFKKRYAAAFVKELSQAEASEAANNLAELYLLLSKPLPSEATPQGEVSESPSPA